MTLEQTTRLIVDASKQGLRVVRLHSGDPTIYSAVREQILALRPYDIDYEIVPGVSSVFASAAALGQQLTSETLVITRPSGKTLEEDQLVELSNLKPTMAILLGVDKIDTIMQRVRYAPEILNERGVSRVVGRSGQHDPYSFRHCHEDTRSRNYEVGHHLDWR